MLQRPYNRRSLVEMFGKTKAVAKGRTFKLKSGQESDFYVDVRKVLLQPRGAVLLADGLLEPILEVVNRGVTEGFDVRVAATGVGGTVLLGALMAWAGVLDIIGFQGVVIRDKAKDHGHGNQIEGDLPENCKLVIIDDVLTAGTSIQTVIEAVGDRAEIDTIVVVVDREENEASQKLGEDYNVFHLLRRQDLEHVAHEVKGDDEEGGEATTNEEEGPAEDAEQGQAGDEEEATDAGVGGDAVGDAGVQSDVRLARPGVRPGQEEAQASSSSVQNRPDGQGASAPAAPSV